MVGWRVGLIRRGVLLAGHLDVKGCRLCGGTLDSYKQGAGLYMVVASCTVSTEK